MTDLSVIAIVISAIAVVLTLLKNFIIPLIFFPRVVLEGKNDSDCIHNAPMAGGTRPSNSQWLRLRIKNEGLFSTQVKNCYVKMLEITGPNGVKVSPFNPTPLFWVSYGTTSAILSKNEEHYVDFILQVQGQNYIAIPKVDVPAALSNNYHSVFGQVGVYKFKVGVYGDNLNGKDFTFKVENTGTWNQLKFVNSA